MAALADRGSRLDRMVESLGRAREMLERYRGTPCEQDYVGMVQRYERRVAVLVRESVGAPLACRRCLSGGALHTGGRFSLRTPDSELVRDRLNLGADFV